MRTPHAQRQDVYRRITQEIVAAIEAGAGTWRMPWHHDGGGITRPTNVASSRPYQGINRLALWVAAQAAGYGSGLWGTYRAWQTVGAQVRKREKATTVVLWKEVRPAHEDEEDAKDETGQRRLFARSFCVFNLAQVENHEPEPDGARLPESTRLAHAEAFLAALNIPTTEGAFDAHYRPDLDRIFLPPFAAFDNPASYIATRLHEAAHATGAAHRLDRGLVGRFGTAAYAAEECIAELTASFVLADLGIAHHPRPDHAAYLASWVEVLKNDSRAIFNAASQAQRAADWMHDRQPRQETNAPVS